MIYLALGSRKAAEAKATLPFSSDKEDVDEDDDDDDDDDEEEADEESESESDSFIGVALDAVVSARGVAGGDDTEE